MATVVEGDFEWDSAKATKNLAKHGISFPEAATVFADPQALYIDDGSALIACSSSGRRCAIECCAPFTSSEENVIASLVRAARR